MFEREDENGIVTLRLAHGKASAMDVELASGLCDQLDEIAASEARAIVLTGTGSIFSAGVDLFRVVAGGEDYAARFLPMLVECITRLFTFPRPAIAAINGHAVAGGCILAAACDRRVMATGTGRIGVPELLVGVPFPAMALEVVRFVVPRAHLQEVVYSGRTYLPDEAVTRGLVDETVEPHLVVERAKDLARQLAEIPPRSFAVTKRHLRDEAVTRARRIASWSDPEAFAVWSAPETRTRISAYLEKTIGRRG